MQLVKKNDGRITLENNSEASISLDMGWLHSKHTLHYQSVINSFCLFLSFCVSLHANRGIIITKHTALIFWTHSRHLFNHRMTTPTTFIQCLQHRNREMVENRGDNRIFWTFFKKVRPSKLSMYQCGNMGMYLRQGNAHVFSSLFHKFSSAL